MKKERYNELMDDVELGLTDEEIKQGWHFCNEFDGLLVLGNPTEKVCGPSCFKWDGTLERRISRVRIWIMWHITDRIYNWWFHSRLAHWWRNWRYYRSDAEF